MYQRGVGSEFPPQCPHITRDDRFHGSRKCGLLGGKYLIVHGSQSLADWWSCPYGHSAGCPPNLLPPQWWCPGPLAGSSPGRSRDEKGATKRAVKCDLRVIATQ